MVKVNVYSEDMDTAEMTKTSEAYLTFVNIDKNGKPRPVPPIFIQTEEEKAEFARAEMIRKKHLDIKKQEK